MKPHHLITNSILVFVLILMLVLPIASVGLLRFGAARTQVLSSQSQRTEQTVPKNSSERTPIETFYLETSETTQSSEQVE